MPLLFFSGVQVHAGHIAGGDITYECLGGEEYEITLTLYRNCAEASLQNQQLIKFSSSCGTFFSQFAPQTSSSEVSQLCPSALPNSTCNGGFWPGIQIFQYKTVATLPTCFNWEIFWELCVRTETNNINDSGSPCYRINAFLNNLEAPCNNSPVISEQNIPYVCVNQQVNYNMGVQEFDGDSLRYYLVPALNFGGFPVPYEAGFSGIAPIPGISIGNNTGQLSFTATNTGLYTVVIEVEEFNSAGILIGKIRKDFIFVVENCPQPVPQIADDGFSSITGSGTLVGGNIIEVCGGDQFCAEVAFSSVNPATEITLSSQVQNILPGSTFNVTGTNPAVAEVCWDVPIGFSSSIQVNLAAQDDACPVFGVAYWSFIVTPTVGVNAGPNIVICEGESAQLQVTGDTDYLWQSFSGDPIIPGVNFSCTDCPNPIATPSQTTTYLVTGLNDNTACINTDTVVVALALKDMNIQLTSESCFLNDASILLDIPWGSGDYSYLWDTGDTVPNLFNIPAGDYGIEVTDNILNCEVDTVLSVEFPPFPNTYAGPDDFACDVFYELQAVPDAQYGFWEAPAGSGTTFLTTWFDPNAPIVVANNGTWTFYWYEDDFNACTGVDSVTITVANPPTLEAGENNGICGLTYTLSAEMTPIGEPFWTGPPGVIFDPDPFDPEATVTVTDYGSYWFYWQLDLGNNCGGIDSVLVTFGEPLVANAGIPIDTICGYEYELQATIDGTNWFWSGIGGGLSFEPDVNSPNAAMIAPSAGTYEAVWSISDDWCVDTDTVQITFIDPPLADAGLNDTVCGPDYQLNASPSFGSGFWSGPTGAVFLPDSADPQATVTAPTYGMHTFVWQEDNGYTCQDADEVTVLFVEQPVADAGEDVVTCGLDYDFALNANGAIPSVGAGTWTANDPSVVFSDPNNPAPQIEVPQQGTYTLTWTEDNDHGCISSDTRQVTFWLIPQTSAFADAQVCGSEALLTGSTTIGNTLWSGPAGADFDPNANQEEVTVTSPDYSIWSFTFLADNNGCVDSSVVEVEFIEIPEANAGPNAASCGLTYSLQAQQGLGTGTWFAPIGASLSDINSPDATLEVLDYGAVTLIWELNNNGCTDTSHVTLQFVEQPVANPGSDAVVCGLQADLQALPSVGSGLWYSNSAADITPGAAGFASVEAPAPGTFTFWWLEDNDFGCIDSASVDVTFVAFPEANAGVNDSICGLQADLAAIPSGLSGLWSSPNPNISFSDPSDPNTTVTSTDYGAYQLIWTEDNGNNCTDSDEITITFVEIPQPDAGSDNQVCGLSTNLNALNPTIGSGLWSGAEGIWSNPGNPQSAVEVPAPGNFIFTWTVSNGNCSATDEVSIQFDVLPPLNAGPDAGVCGLVHELAAVSVTGGGNWNVPAGMTITDATDPNTTVEASSVGTYTLYWVETEGVCIDSAGVEISFIDEPIANAGEDASVCGLEYTLAASGNVPTGSWLPVPGLTFSNPDDANATVTADDFGTYTLTWILSAGPGCEDENEVTITFIEAAVANAGADVVACGLEAELGAIPAGGAGSWSGPAGITFDDESSPTSGVSALNYGTYTLVWTETSAICTTTDEVEVLFIQQPNAEAGNNATVCGLTHLLSAVPSVGDGVWSVSDPGVIFTPSPSSTDATVTVPAQGTFTLTWTETNGICSDEDSIEIDFTSQPVADAGNDDFVCGLSYQLQATGAGGEWLGAPGVVFNPDAFTPNATVVVPEQGTYTFTWSIDAGNDCTDEDEVIIDFYGTPQVSDVVVTCIDGNINYQVSFTISGGDVNSYSVTGGSGTLTGNQFVSDAIPNGGTYNFNVQDANGCQVVNVSGNNVCPNLTYSGTMSQQALQVCGADPAAAIHNNDHTLDGNDALMFILQSNPSLPLGTVYAQAPTPTFTFQPGMQFGVTYYICAVVGNDDGTGAVDFNDPLLSVSVGTPVVFADNPTATVSGSGSACVGDTIWANVVFEGTGPYNFQYSINSVPQAPVETDENNLHIPLISNSQLQPTGVSNAFCSGNVSGVANAQFAPLPQGILSGGGVVCEGDNAQMQVQFSGTAPFTFVYAIDGVPQPEVVTPQTVYNFESGNPGTFTLLEVEDQFCDGNASGEALVDVTPAPVAFAGNDQELCYTPEGFQLGITAQPGWQYQWSNPQLLNNPEASNPQFVPPTAPVVPMTYTFTLTVSNNGCSDTDEVSITVLPTPTLQTNNQVSMCEGGAAQLQVTSANEVQWSPATNVAMPNSPITWVYPPSDQLFTVTAANNFGCDAVGQVQVIVHPMPVVQFTSTVDTACAPAVITFQNLTSSEFLGSCSWNFGNGMIANTCVPSVTSYYPNQGQYHVSLTVTSPFGCKATVTEYNYINTIGPQAMFSYIPERPSLSKPVVQFMNESSGGVQYFWDMGEMGSYFTFSPEVEFPSEMPGEYEVCLTAIDEDGCFNQYCDKVEIEADLFVYIPNAFSPNGDGINDLFYPVMEGVDIVEYEFKIFNRRGMLVWSTTDPEAKWNGADMTGDFYDENQMYVWTLRIKDRYSTLRKESTGTVMLIR